jgi:hypothetical protein
MCEQRGNHNRLVFSMEVYKKLKDTITLQNRPFDSTKITLGRYGIGKPTLRRLVKAGVVSEPIRVGNKHFFDRRLLETELIATGEK